MNALVLVAAAFAILTKVLDCWTTLGAVGPRGVAETNPIGRWLMHRLGVARAVALVFAVSATCTAALAAAALVSGSAVLQWSYVALAGLVASVQACVAHTNCSGRWNLVTVRVLAWHRAIQDAVRRWRVQC